jgi:putative peptide zinc metalloprotease protein
MAAATPLPPLPPLPPLRPGLALTPGPATSAGEPTAVLHDPLRHRFFRLGWQDLEILRRWRLGSAPAVVAALARETPLAVSADDVTGLARFLEHHELTDAGAPGATDRFLKRGAAAPAVVRLVQRALFARIPLVRGDGWLRAALPLVRPLMTPVFAALMGLAALFGLWRLSGQWDVFLATFDYLYTPGGVILLGLAIVLAKVTHELGHGFAAVAAGSRVSSMGVALLVFWPVLFTDTSHAWTLRDRRRRVGIALAGVAAEGILWVIALNAWPLLPDGPLRTICVLFVTVIWLTTVLVNLNPFMRFDGYYLLADLLGVPNLQTRALAFLKGQAGRALFGLPVPPDAATPDRRLGALFWVYGPLLLAYRMVLAVVIALLVRAWLSEGAGTAVFLLLVGVLLVWPAAMLARDWWRTRRHARRWPVLRTLALAALVLAGLAIPWWTPLQTQGVLGPVRDQAVFPALAGTVERVAVAEGDRVAAGDPLVVLRAPDMDHALADIDRRLDAAQLRLEAMAELGRAGESRLVARERVLALRRERESLRRTAEGLTVRAPFDGVAMDLDRTLRPGQARPITRRLMTVADLTACRVVAYVSERALARVSVGQRGRFFLPGRADDPVGLTVARIDGGAARRIEPPALTSRFGGPVPVRGAGTDADADAAVPAEAVYRVELTADACLGPPAVRRGVVVLEAAPVSALSALGRLLGVGVLREVPF